MKRILLFLTILTVLLAVSCTEVVDEPHQHDFNCGKEVMRVEPTCFFDGCVVRQCATCEAEQITPIPSRNSHVSDGGTITRTGSHDVTTYRCVDCGELLSTRVEHRISEEWSHNSVTHWHDYLCGCTAHDSEDTHFYSDFTTEYENGCEITRVTRHTCTTCGYWYETSAILPLHTPGEPEIIGDVSVIRCSVCDAILSVDEV